MSREAATDFSPGRKPWVYNDPETASPERATENSAALSGLAFPRVKQNPGLTPWAKICCRFAAGQQPGKPWATVFAPLRGSL